MTVLTNRKGPVKVLFTVCARFFFVNKKTGLPGKDKRRVRERTEVKSSKGRQSRGLGLCSNKDHGKKVSITI